MMDNWPYYVGRFITAPAVEATSVLLGAKLLEKKFPDIFKKLSPKGRAAAYLTLAALAYTTSHLSRKHLVKSLQQYNPNIKVSMPWSFYYLI